MTSAKSPYEAGMQIIFDPITKTVLVSFRDKVTTLGPFPNRGDAVEAAENYCRKQGWGG